MRHEPVPSPLFLEYRARLVQRLLPGSLAVVNASNIPSTNADGTTMPNSNSDVSCLKEVKFRDLRLINRAKIKYPLHNYRQFARLMHERRLVKSERGIELILRLKCL
jgi:hypothetical protein